MISPEMEAILFKIFSVFNLVGCIYAFVSMIQMFRKYDPLHIFHKCLLVLFGALILVTLNQVATIFAVVNNQWPLKIASTLVWWFALLFCHLMKVICTQYTIKKIGDPDPC